MAGETLHFQVIVVSYSSMLDTFQGGIICLKYLYYQDSVPSFNNYWSIIKTSIDHLIIRSTLSRKIDHQRGAL